MLRLRDILPAKGDRKENFLDIVLVLAMLAIIANLFISSTVIDVIVGLALLFIAFSDYFVRLFRMLIRLFSMPKFKKICTIIKWVLITAILLIALSDYFVRLIKMLM